MDKEDLMGEIITSVVTFGVLLFFVYVAYLIGYTKGNADCVSQAIQHNAAEWRIDSKTGDKELVWLNAENQKTP